MRRQMVTTMYNKINYQRAHSHLNCHVTPPLEHNKGTDFVGVNRTLAAFTIIVLDVLCTAPNKESSLGQGVVELGNLERNIPTLHPSNKSLPSKVNLKKSNNL